MVSIAFCPLDNALAASPERFSTANLTAHEREPVQELWLSVGLRLDDDRTIRRDIVPESDGLLIDTRITAQDERSLEKIRLRTLGYFQADTNVIDIDQSYQLLSGASGPVFDLTPNQRLHVGLGGEVSFYGGDFFSGLGALYLSGESVEPSWLSAYEISVGVERIGENFIDGGDAAWGMAWVTFSEHGLLGEEDYVSLSPGATLYYARQEHLRYEQAEMTLEYGGNIGPKLSGSLWVTGWRRWYASAVEGVAGDRRDWFLEAGVSATAWEVLHPNLSIEILYQYQRNWSNDPVEDRPGASFGFLFHWGF